jgi:hypothetical protein
MGRCEVLLLLLMKELLMLEGCVRAVDDVLWAYSELYCGLRGDEGLLLRDWGLLLATQRAGCFVVVAVVAVVAVDSISAGPCPPAAAIGHASRRHTSARGEVFAQATWVFCSVDVTGWAGSWRCAGAARPSQRAYDETAPTAAAGATAPTADCTLRVNLSQPRVRARRRSLLAAVAVGCFS